MSIRNRDTLTRRSFLGAVGAGAALTSGPWAFAATAKDELSGLDATALAELVRNRKISALELVDAAIVRIGRYESGLNTLITECFELARARTRAAPLQGAFAGVPYLLKDLLEYPGVRYTAGSRMMAANVPDWRSDYVAATEDAGLVVLGKSATPEFGLLAVTEPLLNGPTFNPWNTSYSPGGSSGGAAAAVAAGLVPFAHASDGGGSIRIPASCCGLFGLKPSRGRQLNARRMAFPLEIGVEHCVSWSVRDSARLLSLTERSDAGAPLAPAGYVRSPRQQRLRIAFTTRNYYGRDAEPSVRQAVRATAQLCEELGYEVVEADWPFDGEEFITHFMTVWSSAAAGVAALYRKNTGKVPDDRVLEPWTLAIAEEYASKPEDAMPQALAYFARLAAEYDASFADHDLFLSPVLRYPAVEIGRQGPLRPYAELREELLDWGSYTPMQNAVGVPAMSVPLGMSPEGLPIGSQFTGPLGSEALLLSLAYELESAAPWAGRRPSLQHL